MNLKNMEPASVDVTGMDASPGSIRDEHTAAGESPVAGLPATIEWREEGLYILDQTQLPHATVSEKLSRVEEVWRAIDELRVRGAPAIGVAAAYGLCVAIQPARTLAVEKFREQLVRQAAYLDTARPTAVNLNWSLKRMLGLAARTHADAAAGLYDALLA
jgi:methylthioribose-1-phosphate isomerase